jgi:hypothetical protein
MGTTTIKTTQILKPILDGGVRSINFFNGRLLTGEDLTREQAANREWLGRLGKLLGDGVAGGLFASPVTGKPAVTVSPGLAMNSLGQSLQLSDTFEVSLLRPSSIPDDTLTAPAPPLKDFKDCVPPEQGIYRTGDGIYLLTIAPANGVDGSVPTNGLGNLAASCATRFLVDAVQFRMYSLTSAFTPAERADTTHLRNLMAGRCFGIANAKAFVTDPFGAPPASARLLDKLGKKLPPTDVPLAVFHWTEAGGIDFIDHWSVRRRLAGPPGDDDWSPLLGDRRLAEAEAMMLQFQDHVDAIAAEADTVETVVATTSFDWLPPAGVIPLAGSPSFRGFHADIFFKGLKARDPIFIEGARVAPLLRRALQFPPMNLSEDQMLWVYHVRENAMKADGLSGARVQPYAIFVSGQVPYDGGAAFDVGHWNYASFA